MQDVTILTADSKSVVHVGEGTFEAYAKPLSAKKLYIVTDSNVYALYQDLIKSTFPSAPVYVFPAGEDSKNKDTLFAILEDMMAHNVTRSSTVVAFGGGVVGDVTGLAAALYMRGTHLVQIPTTLLSQVDSSVGGKTAVDFGKVKNAIGTFYQAEEVIVDPLFLKTLPVRELRCGLGEIVKYAGLNAEIFDTLLATPDLFDFNFLKEITFPCIQHKAEVVRQDVNDTLGLRASLNLGHTTGHALELFYNDRSHGEYVLIGTYFELFLLDYLGLIEPDHKAKMESLIHKVIGDIPAFDRIEEAAKLACFDKKNGTAKEIAFVASGRKGEWKKYTMSTPQYLRHISRCNQFLRTGVVPPVTLAVIGKDVSQSLSPQMHGFIASRLGKPITYQKVSIPESEFESQIQSVLDTFDGFNVTIPYKAAVIPHLIDASSAASALSSVNTVVAGHGHSTDGLGFMLMLETAGIPVKGKSVLLLGAGGAGRACAYELITAGASVSVYELFAPNRQEIKERIPQVELVDLTPRHYDIIINATGVGMHKSVGQSPVGEEVLSLCDTAVDLIYVPEKSAFLEIAERLGKPILNGKAMLFYQAYVAEELYFHLNASDTVAVAKRLYEEYCKEYQS